MHQMKTLGEIFTAYAADNQMSIAIDDEKWAVDVKDNPYLPYWHDPKLLLECRTCPADRDTMRALLSNKYKTLPMSYNFPTIGFNGQAQATSINLPSVSHPAELLLLIDVVPSARLSFKSSKSWDTAVMPLCVNSDSSQIRHSGGVNAMFADFHIEHVKWSRLDSSTTEGQQNRTNWLTIQ
jgi:prepilin-type processing-associated H-X9-DG protein